MNSSSSSSSAAAAAGVDIAPPTTTSGWSAFLTESGAVMLRRGKETEPWDEWQVVPQAELADLCIPIILQMIDRQGFPLDWRRELDPLRAAVVSDPIRFALHIARGMSAVIAEISHFLFRKGIYEEVQASEDAGGSKHLRNILRQINKYSQELSLSEEQKSAVFDKLVEMNEIEVIRCPMQSILYLFESPNASIDPRSVAKYSDVFSSSESNMGTLDMFRCLVKTLSRGFQRGKFYAPYLAIVQGSGSGKTTLVLQSQSEDVFVLYLCLRPAEGSTGVPPRSYGADKFLQCKTEGEFQRFYLATLRAMKNWIQANAHLPRRELLQKLHFHCTSEEKVFWSSVLSAWELEPPVDPKGGEVRTALLSCWEDHPALKKSPPLLLFAIDEARALISKTTSSGLPLFPIWRKSTQISMDDSAPMFFVVLDTTARVGNFFPVHTQDWSSRVQRRLLRLCAPFHLFPFTGPWPVEESMSQTLQYEESVGDMTWQPLVALLKHSRPLFWSDAKSAAIRANEPPKGVWDRMLGLAKEKLGFFEQENPGGLMETLCYRFALSPLSQDKAEQLLASRGATLLAVGSLDANITVRYVPEPVYGEACASFFNERLNNVDGLQQLRDIVSNGQAGRAHGKGNQGEFAAMVYLSLVMDGVQKQQQKRHNHITGDLKDRTIFSRPVLLKDFLCALTGLKNPPAKIHDIMGEWKVAFTAWTDALETPKELTFLREAFDKRVALALAPGEKAIDIIIPMEKVAAAPQEISVMCVQIKNQLDHIHRGKAMDLCFAQIATVKQWGVANPVVSLLLMVGPGRVIGKQELVVDESDCFFFVRDGCLCVVSNGFASPLISAQIDHHLRLLRMSSDAPACAQAANQLAVIASLSKDEWMDEQVSTNASEQLKTMNAFSVAALSKLQTWPGLQPDSQYCSLGEMPLFESSSSSGIAMEQRNFVRSSTVSVKNKGMVEFFVVTPPPHPKEEINDETYSESEMTTAINPPATETPTKTSKKRRLLSQNDPTSTDV